MVLAPGATVGDFVVERLLGWGGMGVVYLARQPELERVVALKVIDPAREGDAGLRARFQRESRIAASIDHPHVLPIYEAGEAEGVLYLAMRFVDGTDLRTVLAQEGKLAPERALALTTQIAGALDAAHARGLVHRDVKPANILLAAGTPEHAYLTDFGVAKRTATVTDLTRQGALIGSVDYVPPEQIEGRELGPAADVYALGATLFHMLAGRPPREGDSDAAVLQAHLTGAPPALRELRPELPELLDGVIARAMAREPAERYRSAGEFAKDLATVLAPTVTATRAPGATRTGGATVVPDGDGTSCPACGAVTTPGARFCATCGVPIAARPSRETRRLVSAVRVELSGTTVLGDDIDPERRRILVTRARERVVGALEAHGALVRDEGRDAITGLFGVAGVREDDALRAVRAAVEVGERIDAMNAELEHREHVAARMGVGTGEAVVSDAADPRASVEGEVLAVSARLAVQAAPNEVLLSAATETLVREAVQAEALELRGGGGERAFAVRALVEGAEAIPRLAEGPTIGRDREIDQLRDVFERAVEKQRSALVTLLGPPGIGKSRLASVLSASVADEARTLEARCFSYGVGSAYGPLLDVVRDLGGEDPVGSLAALMGGGERAGMAATQIAGALGLVAGEGAGDQAAWAFVQLFEALAEQGPTLVVFEDIHWAEAPLLDLIEKLADEIRDLPLVLVCLSRPELLEERTTWGGGMTNATTMLLDPLSRTQSEALVAELDAGGALDPDHREQIVQTAEGNPLFLEQTIAFLRDRSDATRGAGLPATIQSLLAARLDRLPAEDRGLLSRAAVVGREFTRSALLALTPENEREGIDERLRGLVRREMIGSLRARGDDERPLRFGHALIRDTAYAALPKQTRSDLHHTYADWLERSSTAVAELDEVLGYHLEQAYAYRVEVGEQDEAAAELAGAAIGHLATAGRRAIAREDLQSGLGLLRRATALPAGEDSVHLGLLAEMAPSLVDLSDIAEVERVLREIVRTIDPTPTDPLDALARSLEAPLSEADAVEAALLTAEKAARVFRTLGDDRHLAQILLVIGDLHGLRCRTTPAKVAYEEAIPLARRCGDVRTERVLAESLSAALYNGPEPLSAAAARVDEFLERAIELDLVSLRGRLLAGRALIDMRRGDAASARAPHGRGRRHAADALLTAPSRADRAGGGGPGDRRAPAARDAGRGRARRGRALPGPRRRRARRRAARARQGTGGGHALRAVAHERRRGHWHADLCAARPRDRRRSRRRRRARGGAGARGRRGRRRHGVAHPPGRRLPRPGRGARLRRTVRRRGRRRPALARARRGQGVRPGHRPRPGAAQPPDRAGLGRVDFPVGGRAESGALDHLQGEQRALHARGGDVDPQQVEHEVLVQAHEVVHRLALELVGDHRGRCLADRAAVAREPDLLDPVLGVELDLDLQLVAAERVEVLELEVGLCQLAPVVGPLVVLEDVLAVEVVHRATPPLRPRP